MRDAGVTLAFGSDSPVTPMDPWRAVRAAVHHHDPAQRLDARRGPRRPHRAAAGDGSARTSDARRRRRLGGKVRGAPAYLAVWDVDDGLADGPGRDLDGLVAPDRAARLRPDVVDGPGRSRRTARVAAPRQERSDDEAGARQGARAEGTHAVAGASAGRSSSWPSSTPRSRSSGPRCGWAASPARTPTARPGSTALLDAVARRRRARARRRRCRCGTRWSAARPRTSPRSPQKAAAGSVRFRLPEGTGPDRARSRWPAEQVGAGHQADRRPPPRARAAGQAAGATRRSKPWIYLIVATGDIYEDMPQAQAAAREGADIIAVIRSTGQSLLDFVPEGPTREGFAGTYATQENFRLMRGALDEASKEVGRYVRLTNYASGLCMPEIADAGRARAARHDAQRLDVRDPLPRHQPGPHLRRPAVQPAGARPRRDHHQHRRGQLPHHRRRGRGRAHGHGRASCSTSTSPRRRGSRTGSSASATPSRSTPTIPDSFRLELAHALLARQLFPDAPLKWMPPTRHMTGDVFRGYLLDAFFNLAGAMTDQGILLVGMMTEAVVTPWLSDRDLALQNVRYVLERRRRARRGLPARRPTASSPGGPTRCWRRPIDLLERIASTTSRAGCSTRSPTAPSAS